MDPEQTEHSSCTEDRIEHVLERCLCDLGLDTPDKRLWNAGLCINRWCLEELVKRDPQNFLILLNKILRKTEEVLERCDYELVVPLTLLFTSTLLKAPHVPADCGLLQEASRLFHRFLSWPKPCSSACRRLLRCLQLEMRAPGISFQRLMRAEQAVSCDSPSSKTIDNKLLLDLGVVQKQFVVTVVDKNKVQNIRTMHYGPMGSSKSFHVITVETIIRRKMKTHWPSDIRGSVSPRSRQ